MSKTWSIKAEGLGKDYPLAEKRSDFFFKELFNGKREPKTFTALDSIDFELTEGETLGIVGSNGSGKSTLLKILSRVTRPTRGRVELKGRVAPLLEVGTGFHPDLSGRDNAYLNGSLLGMNREEVRKVFDEIVDFSGVEQFIDQPVKHYSSGMYIRLAFAVAAHLRAEIMLVDEVLAVGDLAFQQKCLDKMESLSQSGRSVLLVTHQIENMLRLCDRALWIESGRMRTFGDAEEVAQDYRQSMLDKAKTHSAGERKDRRGSGELRLEELTLLDENGQRSHKLATHQRFRLQLAFSGNVSEEERDSLRIQLHFYNQDERYSGSIDSGTSLPHSSGGALVKLIAEIPYCPFYAGSYWVVARLLLNGRAVDRVESVLHFEVETGKDSWTHRKSGMRYSVNWSLLDT
jgi:lipopolysaccharide transport system ATP-binding protein